MTNREIEKAMERLCDKMPGWLRREGFKPNNCILGTRIAVGYLRGLGVTVRPVPVKVEVYSPEYMRRLRAKRRPTDPGEDEHEWAEAGAWVVVAGHGTPTTMKGWDGHLVAQVQHRYLLDVTAHQFTRPAKQIDVDPFWHPVPAAFWRDEGALEATADTGVVLRYIRFPEAGDHFLKSYDWRGITVEPLGRRGERGWALRSVRTPDDYKKTMEARP